VYPSNHSFKGLEKKDFEKKISKEEMKKLLTDNGHTIIEGEFTILYYECLKENPDINEKISYASFITFLKKNKREFNKYRLFI